MWFDEIMEDCKCALRVACNYSGIFIPAIVNAVIRILLFSFLIISGLVFAVKRLSTLSTNFETLTDIKGVVIAFIIVILLIYLIFTILGTIIELGCIYLIKIAVDGVKLKAVYFFEGVRKYFFRVLSATLFMHLICLICFPLILTVFLLYSLTVGTLTGGWGTMLLFILLGTYFSVWKIAIIVDNMNPFNAVAVSIKLGYKYFWPMFLLTLASFVINKYLITAFGPLITLVMGWIINGIIATYFKIVYLLVFKRKLAEIR